MFSYNKARFPIICGIEGLALNEKEISFFKNYPPVGFILFARNIKNEKQVRNLTTSLKEVLNEEVVPILIDEEGGNVSRIKVLKDAPSLPSASFYGQIKDTEKAKILCRQHYETIGSYLHDLGITVNCAPVLDTTTPQTYASLQARCFSLNSQSICEFGAIAIQSMKSTKCIPVMKHLPGKGSAVQDSHFVLPTISLTQKELEQHIVPFKENAKNCPWAMSSHPIFSAWDTKNPATFSEYIIQNIVRKKIGFEGFLITDDLYMLALESFSLTERINRALASGHDAVLLCHGNPSSWENALQDLKPLSSLSTQRLLKTF